VDNIVLTGFMGTGKTSVGREVGTRLLMEFVDTDEIIEARHGPIDRIFAENGEQAFRRFERDVASELGQRKRLVIATGGRMLLDPANLDELTRNGRVFCLVASPEEIHRRVTTDEIRSERPLLGGDDPQRRIAELMTERSEGYARFPQIETDHRDVAAVADEIVRLWVALQTT
jgi:shikimate kinase